MFVYRKVYPFTWPVKISDCVVPAFEFQGKFESVDQDTFEEFAKDPVTQDEKLSKAVFRGWVGDDGPTDENGNVLEATPENVEMVRRLPFIRTAIVRTYVNAMSGLYAKN